MSTHTRGDRGPVELVFVAVLNAMVLVLINTHAWWRPLLGGIITERFSEVVWAANLAAATQIVGSLLMIRWFASVPRRTFELAFSATALINIIVTAMVFPFDLERFGPWGMSAGHVAIGVLVILTAGGALGSLGALLSALVRSLRHVGPHTDPMRVRVIYESLFGNTRDVALAIARGLRRFANVEVEVTEVGEADANAPPCDVLVVGGPVHAFSMSRGFTRDGAKEQAQKAGREVVSRGVGVRDYLDKLPENDHGLAATFDTAAQSTWFPVGSAARPAARVLDDLGYTTVMKPEHFFVQDVMGPLLDGELQRAEAWGTALGSRCTSHVPGGTQITLHERA